MENIYITLFIYLLLFLFISAAYRGQIGDQGLTVQGIIVTLNKRIVPDHDKKQQQYITGEQFLRFDKKQQQ